MWLAWFREYGDDLLYPVLMCHSGLLMVAFLRDGWKGVDLMNYRVKRALSLVYGLLSVWNGMDGSPGLAVFWGVLCVLVTLLPKPPGGPKKRKRLAELSAKLKAKFAELKPRPIRLPVPA